MSDGADNAKGASRRTGRPRKDDPPFYPLVEGYGQDFREWRARMGWTKKEAARQLGICTTKVSFLEAGRSPKGELKATGRCVQLAIFTLENREDWRL